MFALYHKHPEYDYSVLVRTAEKGGDVAKSFPGVRTIVGSLDDSDLLKREAANADVVIRPSTHILPHFTDAKTD